MKEIDIIKTYYQRIVEADFPHSREIRDDEPRVACTDETGCHGDGKNVLWVTFDTSRGRLRDFFYECEYCDVTMYVTAELVSELVEGCSAARVGQIGDAQIIDALGGRSRKVIRQAKTALRLLAESLGAAHEPLD
jgi:hypothetical protein